MLNFIQKPNILLITIDCLKAELRLVESQKKELTTFLNKLARESFVFTQLMLLGPYTLCFP